ncbi:MAG: hypothetical protein AB2L20_05485 [Mangrovibacterium sp.]
MITRLAAHFIFPVSGAPIAKGIIEVEHDGTIVNLISPEGELRELAHMEFHNGIICPGFIDLFREYSENELFECFPKLLKYKGMLPADRTGDRGMLEWIKSIQLSDTGIDLEELFRMFILDPATALGKQAKLGTLDRGKRPGILLIDRMDYRNLRLSKDSRVKRLI